MNDLIGREAPPCDPAALSFMHEGRHVLNPFLSACGRYAVDPAVYGFSRINTGDGASAMVRRLDDGGTLWLTGEDGVSIPDVELWHEARIIRFDPDGRPEAWAMARDLPHGLGPLQDWDAPALQ